MRLDAVYSVTPETLTFLAGNGRAGRQNRGVQPTWVRQRNQWEATIDYANADPTGECWSRFRACGGNIIERQIWFQQEETSRLALAWKEHIESGGGGENLPSRENV